MENIQALFSNSKKTIVKIEEGELISFIKNNEELIHQKGNPGWRSADTEMFPIIGPTAQNNFKVETPKGIAIQDQHGLLREMEYNLISIDLKTAVYEKKYVANTIIKNSKFPNKSSEENLFWPYNFIFKKSFELTTNSLKITFEIESEKNMPFMLGYHPAFMLNGKLDEIIKTEKQEVSIPNIIKGGDTAFPILDCNTITLVKKRGENVILKTQGFKNFMLWTAVSNMVCIEPITAYPYLGDNMLDKTLFNSSKNKNIFSVEII